MAHRSIALPDDSSDEEQDQRQQEPSIDETRKKRKKKDTKGEPDPHEEYMVAARAITRCIDLWCDVDKVVKTVQLIRQEQASDKRVLQEEELVRKSRQDQLSKISEEVQDRCLQTYSKLLQMVPAIKDIVSNTAKSAELSAITDKMNACIRQTRSNDATRLKSSIGLYVAPNPRKEGLTPPIVNTSGRAEMGLNHPTLARFLCPIDHLSGFDEDVEETCASLKSGKICMSADALPSFLWSGDWPGKDYDSADELHGLFRSYFLVRVGRHIFLGPSSALGDDTRATRSCNAILHDMTTVEAAHIAYICVQACFAISSKSSWSQQDGEFDYVKFYRYIESLIDDPVDEVWKDALLKWWNKELFGNENGRGHNNSSDMKQADNNNRGTSPVPMTTMERLRAKARTRASTSSTSISSNTDRNSSESRPSCSTSPNQSRPSVPRRAITPEPSPGGQVDEDESLYDPPTPANRACVPRAITPKPVEEESLYDPPTPANCHREEPATPPRQSGSANRPTSNANSPLTPDNGPLTPLTNVKEKARQPANKGKKRKVADVEEASGATSTANAKQDAIRRSKRNRK